MRLNKTSKLLSLSVCLGVILGFFLVDYSMSQSRRNREAIDPSQYYKKWLDEDVTYIISNEEKQVFKNLNTVEEKEKFIEQFWLRRDPDPRTAENEFKEEHYRRIAYANERFTSGIPGWRTDRGRIYIMYGEPAQIESHPTGGTYNREIYEGGGTTTVYPFEKWRYRHIDNIGDDIEIEFVDPSGTGEYRMAMSPDEKDALMNVPGAGLTLTEQMGLSKKEDRPYFNAGNANNSASNPFMRAKDSPFSRMEQFFSLQRPPEVKFNDLKGIVTTHITYDELPYALRTDFIRLGSDKVLVPITIELRNKDLQFKKELNFNRAVVNVYGLITNLTGRIAAEFEHAITQEFTDEFFEQGKGNRSEYQKIVALPPGQRFKLDLVLKDVNSGMLGATSIGINVPKYDDENLQSSTIILANSVTPVLSNTDQLEQYVIGDLKILPNVKSEYVPGQNLIPYLQIYNAGVDQATLKPSLEVTFTLKSDGKVVEELADLGGESVQFFSGQRIVILGKIPLTEINPGKYTLEVKVLDKVSNRSLVNETQFKVNEPVQTAAVTP